MWSSLVDLLPANSKAPIIMKPTPERSLKKKIKKNAGDFCYEGGKNYLILVDCYSDRVESQQLG